MEHTLIVILIIALVAGVSFWLVKQAEVPASVAAFKWIAQIVIIAVAVIALLRLI